MTDNTAQKADDLIAKGRRAASSLLDLSEKDCNQILEQLASILVDRSQEIISANQKDLDEGAASGLSKALLDRLALNVERVQAIALGVKAVATLKAPLGEEISRYDSPKGIQVKRIRVPLGLLCIIFESRPNVTIETSILALKSRNSIILKGGKEAKYSNEILANLVREAISSVDSDPDAVQLIGENGREIVADIIGREDGIDLVIPRGGEGLIRAVSEQSRVPVLKHYKGVCHVYVDESADLSKALPIAINAKCQRPSVCNAMETLLVHEGIAEDFLPKVGTALKKAGVAIRGDDTVVQHIPEASKAEEADWSEEYLELTLSIRVVSSLEEATLHINKYGSHHTDAIVSEDSTALNYFSQQVDSGSIMLNTSTRFADGFEYGLGAELGISTDKVHARGPMGLEGLTTYKWIVESDGAIRE